MSFRCRETTERAIGRQAASSVRLQARPQAASVASSARRFGALRAAEPGGPPIGDPVGTEPGAVTSAADGRYVLSAPPGRAAVQASILGHRAAASAPVEVTAGAEAIAGDIVLERVGVGRLRLRVLGSDGAPYRGEIQVVARSDDADGARTLATGEDGLV